MKKLAEYIYARTSLAASIGITLAMGTYAWLVMGGQSECFQNQLEEGVKVFGLTFGLSKEYALSVFQSLNPEGLICYKRLMLIWDNIFPLIYCSMYLFWLSYFLKDILPRSLNIRILNLYPLIPAILDWAENITEVGMVNYFIDNTDITSSLITLNSTLSQSKWIASYLNYSILALSITLFIYHKINKIK